MNKSSVRSKTSVKNCTKQTCKIVAPAGSFCLLAGVLFCTPAYAGAWLQEQGQGQLIVTANSYRAREYFDNGGQRTSQQTFTKGELNPYVEYGLNPQWTVGASLFLPYAQQDDATGALEDNYALGDSEWFARTALWQQGGSIVSLKSFIKLPGVDDSRDVPKLISTHPDAGLALSGGTNFALLGYATFADVEASYRYRFGPVHDQVQINTTLGTRITPTLMIMPQVFATWRTDSAAGATFSQSPQDDYNLVKGQVSVVAALNESTDIQAGGFLTLDGRNTGDGNGFILAVWRRF